MSPDRAAFLSRLSAGMAAKGIGQSDLARLANVSRQTINTMFAEGRPGRKHLPAFARVLGCSVEWLTTGTGPAPSWADSVDSVYGVSISSRNNRDGLDDAVVVARKLHEGNVHELVDSLFFDTGVGHLILHEKDGISDAERGKICDVLSQLDGLSGIVEYGSEYYPDPNEIDPDVIERENLKEARRIAAENRGDTPEFTDPQETEVSSQGAPAWAARILEEVQALRREVRELRRQANQPKHEQRREGVETRGHADQFMAGHALADTAPDELARIMDPDEHPRPEAPTYPRPTAIPGDSPGGR